MDGVPSRPSKALRGVDDGMQPNAAVQLGVWQERGSYRVKGPDPERKAEADRIRQRDEESLRKLNAQRRQQLLQEMRRGSSASVVGSIRDSAVSHDEGRSAWLRKLESERDPAMQRLKKKEEEKRKKQQEKEKQEQSDKERLHDWQRREKAKAEKDKKLNEEKRRHWEQLDTRARAASGGGGGSSSADVPVPLTAAQPTHNVGVQQTQISPELATQMAGTWVWNRNEYSIQRSDDGALVYAGRDRAGQPLSGRVEMSQGEVRAQLRKSDGTFFGTMRFAYDPSSDHMWSNFQRPGSQSEGGKDVVAERISRTAAVGQLAAHGVVGFAEAWQCGVCTLINEHARATCEMCETPKYPISLRPVQARPSGPPSQRCSSSLGCAQAPSLPATGPASLSSSSAALSETTRALSMPPSPPAAAGETPLMVWLRRHRLESYFTKLVEDGFEELEDLQAADPQELEKVLTDIGVKTGHLLRFRRALQEGADIQSPSASSPPAASGGGFECSVCLAGESQDVNVALIPCGHVYCRQHAEQARAANKCHTCREPVQSVQRIFG
eukprot:TRINITY_DN49003_c0_g3_i1.p1 TRINITY_DN49003_c0_g3~~TRINITY_DN49003_c0_g3_i1.p1  ORF type:complete len:608 (+),score=112.93 TRINITY_DN49003_c0_g3_i1:167-1825(+)